MNRFSLPLTRLIHENLSIVMCFAYSRKPLVKMMKGTFSGSFRYLRLALFDISEERALRACVELALFMRMLDDEKKISEYHSSIKHVINCGRLIKKNGKEEVLTFREVANKVLHSSRLQWKFPKDHAPLLVCHSREKEKWLRAEVDIVALAAICGTVMS